MASGGDTKFAFANIFVQWALVLIEVLLPRDDPSWIISIKLNQVMTKQGLQFLVLVGLTAYIYCG
jgi:hypothetical protein